MNCTFCMQYSEFTEAYSRLLQKIRQRLESLYLETIWVKHSLLEPTVGDQAAASNLSGKLLGCGDHPRSLEEFISRYDGLATALLDNPNRKPKLDPEIIRRINALRQQ